MHQVVMLKDHPDIATDLAHLTLVHAGNLTPVEHDTSLRSIDKAIDTAQKSGFTCPRRPDNRDELATTKGKRHIVQRFPLAVVAFRQVLNG